jgi:hypothetical protein
LAVFTNSDEGRWFVRRIVASASRIARGADVGGDE